MWSAAALLQKALIFFFCFSAHKHSATPIHNCCITSSSQVLVKHMDLGISVWAPYQQGRRFFHQSSLYIQPDSDNYMKHLLVSMSEDKPLIQELIGQHFHNLQSFSIYQDLIWTMQEFCRWISVKCLLVAFACFLYDANLSSQLCLIQDHDQQLKF